MTTSDPLDHEIVKLLEKLDVEPSEAIQALVKVIAFSWESAGFPFEDFKSFMELEAEMYRDNWKVG